MNVNNGHRFEVDLPNFKGVAGFVERLDRGFLSYLPQTRGAVRVGSKVMINGQEWEVLSVSSSDYMRKMRVIELRR